jgi:hypothetical protein
MNSMAVALFSLSIICQGWKTVFGPGIISQARLVLNATPEGVSLSSGPAEVFKRTGNLHFDPWRSIVSGRIDGPIGLIGEQRGKKQKKIKKHLDKKSRVW